MRRTEPTRTLAQGAPYGLAYSQAEAMNIAQSLFQSQWLSASTFGMQAEQMSAFHDYCIGQQDAMRNALAPPGPRKTMPTRTLLQGAPYVPSWAMHWRSTLGPYLAGHRGLVGGWRDQIVRNVKEADK